MNNLVSPQAHFDMSGRVALITGGGGGIGSALAEGFVAAGGAAVVADLAFPHDGPLPSIQREVLDVRDDAAVEDLARRLTNVDVIVHCAGRLERIKEFEIATFKDIVDIHLFGCMRLAMAFRSHLRERRGCMVNIASMYSYYGSPRIPAYAAAKTAIVSLTKSLALSFADDGVRVNAIAPGWIETEISRGGREDLAFNEKVMQRLPTKRWSSPTELVGPVLFLASEAASLVNGVTLPVDGGYTAS